MVQTRDSLREQVGAQYDFDAQEPVESSLAERKNRELSAAIRDGKDQSEAEKAFDDKSEETLLDVKSSMRAMFVLTKARNEEIDASYDVIKKLKS